MINQLVTGPPTVGKFLPVRDTQKLILPVRDTEKFGKHCFMALTDRAKESVSS